MYIVIMGGGKVGEYLGGVLLSKGHEVAIIEHNRKTADRLSITLEGEYLIINGDGCDTAYQQDAGIRKADVFVAVTGRDEDNLVACELATRVFNVPRCIARVNNPKNRNIFRAVGIENVSSTILIASMIEEEALMGGMGVVSSLGRGDIALIEVSIPRSPRHFDPKEGVLARRIRMPEGSILAAVDRKEAGEAEVIDKETVLYPGDKAVVLAETDAVDQVKALFKSL
ncbi:Trk system potassium uptake protein trkA [Slackia heliotrinireducens]|jgi:trk system potassium uptake protein TrkA|uniref:Trk system potassium uptake protein TrkA n=1 Tax=Slackia heliotrinireducens (strain ATCC 29202 / DSM 20476 / NCTC 11029 / RHS 1) TaxID=471855 RepID=C7N0M6_SLAHD|nr:TrkA family potassium uptake protein [Slackia heliotrinireducens]ACV21104.1 K+ transport system, NAD-binding component [Slackia heliotrinireducens DSM 20476]VEH03606.1 Trk system potassium uptake protein trkA [Slackia heliotrinireducens]